MDTPPDTTVLDVNLQFTPKKGQRECYLDMKRLNCYVQHRRFGKSYGGLMRLLTAAARTRRKNAQYAFIGPWFKQTTRIAWKLLKDKAEIIPGTKIDETGFSVRLVNGAEIMIMGGNNPDSIRGSYLDGLVLDEVADIKPTLWSDVLWPMLNDAGRQGWAILQGTPKGINLLSERYNYALAHPDVWSAKKFTVYETDTWTPAEIEAIKKEMPESKFAQEFLCDFSAGNNSCLLTEAIVTASMLTVYPSSAYYFAPRIMGVDVARQGDDSSVIVRRQGQMGAWEPIAMQGHDAMTVAAKVMEVDETFKASTIFVDGSGGYGAGVVDRLRQLGKHNVVEVQFGGSPDDPRYANKRSEMYFRMAEWIKQGGSLPNHQRLKLDLCAPEYTYANAKGKMAMESKESIKERGLPSSDFSDALALTFAFVVHSHSQEQAYELNLRGNNERSNSSWDWQKAFE